MPFHYFNLIELFFFKRILVGLTVILTCDLEL